MKKDHILYIAVSVIVILLIIAFARSSSTDVAFDGEALDLCVTHGSEISMHIHPELYIYVDGEQVIIPADVGITPDCMKAVHTHDETGKLHLEYPQQYDFVLGDFFAVWEQPFSATELLDYSTEDGGTIRMLVDGQESDAYEDLVLEDLQQIELYYESAE